MITTTQTIQIKSLETCLDKEGSPISFGLADIYSYGNIDEIPFRAKGNSAIAIKEAGIGTAGCAQGYIDISVQPREEYKEKLFCLVIRNFRAEHLPQQQQAAIQTPDFAKELLDTPELAGDLPNEDNEQEGVPPF